MLLNQSCYEEKDNLIGFMLKDMCPEYSQYKGTIDWMLHTEKSERIYHSIYVNFLQWFRI